MPSLFIGAFLCLRRCFRRVLCCPASLEATPSFAFGTRVPLRFPVGCASLLVAARSTRLRHHRRQRWLLHGLD